MNEKGITHIAFLLIIAAAAILFSPIPSYNSGANCLLVDDCPKGITWKSSLFQRLTKPSEIIVDDFDKLQREAEKERESGIADWETHTTEWFTFMYPSDWYIKQPHNGVANFNENTMPDSEENLVVFRATSPNLDPTAEKDIEAWFDKWVEQCSQAGCTPAPGNIVDQTIIANIPAIKVERSNVASDLNGKYYSYFFAHGKYVYTIETHIGRNTDINTEAVKTLQTIISTFEFLQSEQEIVDQDQLGDYCGGPQDIKCPKGYECKSSGVFINGHCAEIE